jgi:hypothetical protein
MRWALLLILIASCKPKVGATCKSQGDRACADESTVIVCQGGTWASFPCRGASGCSKQGDGVFCDVANGKVGDPCPNEDEKRQTCSDDHKSRLTCMAGKYVGDSCIGVGCMQSDDGKVTCDLGQPELGTTCDATKDRATCGRDHKSHIHCDASTHKWTVERICRGPSGCQRLSVNEQQVCDITLADVGDPCRIDEASRTVCSSDRKAKLGCKDGKWSVESACAQPCGYDDGTVTCDPLTGCVMIPTGASCGK